MRTRILDGFALILESSGEPWHTPIISSLDYQARALGMSLTRYASPLPRGRLAAILVGPAGESLLCNIGGWGDEDAHKGSEPVSELLIQAACGITSIHARARGVASTLGVPYVSTLTATLTLQGLIAAMYGRLRGLSTTEVRTSLAASALLSVGQYVAEDTCGAERPPGDVCGNGEAPPFHSRDGIPFEIEAIDPTTWRDFWAAAGASTDCAAAAWPAFAQRYATATARIPQALVDCLAEVDFVEIALMARTAKVAVVQIRTLKRRELDPDASAFRERGPWAFSGPLLTESRTAPTGNHRYSREVAEGDSNLPLKGARVVECTSRIQGPLAGHLLSLLGAEVTRIEPPGGDPLRYSGPLVGDKSARYDAINRLKRTAEIDIKSPQGRTSLLEIVAAYDVFLHNWAPGKASAMALDFNDLAAVNDNLVYAYAGAWGLDTPTSVFGTDFTVQAFSGVAHRIGDSSGSSGGSLFTVLDVLGAAISAQAICAALLARELTPSAVRVDTSLLGAASLLTQSETCRDKSASNSRIKGVNSDEFVLRASDGWIAIDCSIDELGTNLNVDAESNLLEALSAKVREASTSELCRHFENAGIPAITAIQDLAELSENPRFRLRLAQAEYTQVTSPWSFQ
ncbi:CoA transferase [Pandoraea pnomenusa]|uniref:CoA transferase n=1 Tax=Pandoraea pnomenusa TaxID=93220 RepID=UPI00333F6A3B